MGSLWEEGTYEPQKLKETLHLLPWSAKPTVSSHPKSTTVQEISEKCNCKINTINKEEISIASSSTSQHMFVSCKCKFSCKEEKSINIEGLVYSGTEETFESVECVSKKRHISVDSAKDSGIGENSNFTDLESCSKFESIEDVSNIDEEGALDKDISTKDFNVSNDSEVNLEKIFDSKKELYSNLLPCDNLKSENSNSENKRESDTDDKNKSDIDKDNNFKFDVESNNVETDLRGYWEPKQKRSITERLPEDSFYLIPPSRYIFPGAEVYLDPDEKCNYFDDSSTDSSESESEIDNEQADSSF